jgi:hypothetical protein
MSNHKKGVTLVELIGAIAIGGIAMGLIATIFISFVASLNAIYARGSANSQGILLTTTVLTKLNQFEPTGVTLNMQEDTLIFSRELDVFIIRKIQDGDHYLLEIEENFQATEFQLINHTFKTIDFSITPSDNNRLKTVRISITITSGDVDYTFVVSFLVINYN